MAATHFEETIQNLVDAQNLVDEMQAILHKQSSVFEACCYSGIAHLLDSHLLP